MALNTSKCNCQMPLWFKGFKTWHYCKTVIMDKFKNTHRCMLTVLWRKNYNKDKHERMTYNTGNSIPEVSSQLFISFRYYFLRSVNNYLIQVGTGKTSISTTRLNAETNAKPNYNMPLHSKVLNRHLLSMTGQPLFWHHRNDACVMKHYHTVTTARCQQVCIPCQCT